MLEGGASWNFAGGTGRLIFVFADNSKQPHHHQKHNILQVQNYAMLGVFVIGGWRLVGEVIYSAPNEKATDSTTPGRNPRAVLPNPTLKSNPLTAVQVYFAIKVLKGE